MSAVSYQGPKPHQAGGPTSSNDRLHASIGTARTRVDDLQAEMEAAVRRADRIDVEVSAIENQMVQHFELAAQLGTLSRHSRELRASMIQQRSLLRELRRSLNEIRQALSTFNPDVK